MKYSMTRVIVLFLLLSILLSSVVFAAPVLREPEETDAPTLPLEPEGPSEPEGPTYIFPDDWSRDALIYAVENGILKGDENNDLLPQNYITRAQMAAVLVRMLGATAKADLSMYTDVSADAWYYEELSMAVAAGIFNGVSETTMEPESPVTREQTVTVLCRAFGIVGLDRNAHEKFTDAKQISSYAQPHVGALSGLEKVSGYPEGDFRPANPITRAEVAQLVYKLFDVMADDAASIPEAGWVLYRGMEPLPADLKLDGTLVLGQTAPNSIDASGWELSGSLVICTGADTQAELRGLKASHVVCAAVSGSATGDLETVCLAGKAMDYEGDCQLLINAGGSHKVKGHITDVQVRNGSLLLEDDADTASVEKDGTLEVAGNCNEVVLWNNSKLIVSGRVKHLTVKGSFVTATGDGYVEEITVDNGPYTIDVPYGTLGGYYLEYLAEHDTALSVVQTQRVACDVLRDTWLCTSNSYSASYICPVPKGSVVYNEWHPAGDWFYCSLEDGTKGWIPRWDCYIPDDTITTNGSLDYSDPIKEGFVDLMGYSSDTEYLVWVSRYTQKVIVFQGFQGYWRVIETFPCSSGENNTPTPEGVYSIYSRTGRWNFDYYYVDDVSIFSGGHAFHSILMNYDGTIYDDRVGIPLSHGCIRMRPEDCLYIYRLPEGTTVVIY